MSSCACVHDAPGATVNFQEKTQSRIFSVPLFVEDSRLIDLIGKNRNDGIPVTRGREELRWDCDAPYMA